MDNLMNLSEEEINADFELLKEVVVNGRKLVDWLMSDEGLVDYEKSEFGHNISNTEEWIIYDMGGYWFDPGVRDTIYEHGIDMARLAGAKYNYEPYDDMAAITPYDGYDVIKIFLGSFDKATVKDYILYHYKLIDGYAYISETSHHVYVKGRVGSKEEREAAYADLSSRYRG